jgi:2-dehydropantoate 2-reductase
MAKNVKILLFGTGAVGSFYGSILARGGASVSAVCRSDYDIVKDRGIEIKSINGDFHFSPHKVFRSASECDAAYDYIIVALKALPQVDTVSIIKDAVSENTSIVLLQNGINIEESVAAVFPENEIISALAFICVTRVDFGLIDHQDQGRISFGTYPEGISPKAAELAEIFKNGGVSAEVVQDVIAARWQKLMWNAPFNPLSVIGGGADTRSMLGSDVFTELVKDVMKEVADLSIADGHPIDYEMIDKTVKSTYKMTPYKTSMLLDYENRRPMEVEVILGNAVKMGEKYEVDVPRLKTLYSILSFMDVENLK